MEPVKKFTFDPARHDFIFRIFTRVAGGNPYSVAFLYFIVSFGGMMMLGALTGLLTGEKSGLTPMYNDYANLANMGLLSPLGAWVLVNFYRKLMRMFSVLPLSGALPMDNRFEELGREFQPLYESRGVLAAAFAVAATFAFRTVLNSPGDWYGINGGITSFYTWIFVVINYAMIMVILYKCLLTVRLLSRVLDLPLVIQPLHTDGCGGLRSIGDTSLAINYFNVVVMAFMMVLAVFQPDQVSKTFFLVLFLTLIAATIASLVSILFKAHVMMTQMRDSILSDLNTRFQKALADCSNDAQGSDTIHSLNGICAFYREVTFMPVWPYDAWALKRFLSSFSLSVIIILVEMITNTDSIVYNLGKITLFRLFRGN
ncbi:MAG: hypothetical protein PHQ23_03770 [Candidatus Wallbacteria bacterium]|nr:hypothetical protein [Candidatus Wallbacteria bacterium]